MESHRPEYKYSHLTHLPANNQPSIHTMSQVIVVGGGLAGLSAAHTVLERGGNVLLLDKQGCATPPQPSVCPV